MSNVELFKFCLKSGQFSFPLLVKLHLGSCVSSSFLKLCSKIFQILLQDGSALLSLCPVATFNGKFLIKFFKARLKLFDLLVVLAVKM